MSVPFNDLSRIHDPLRPEFERGIAEIFASNAFVLGPAVAAFEKAWAEYTGAAHAIGVQSGTAALMAALDAVGVGPGDEVITAANTFVATAGAIHFLGATPVLVDILPDTLQIDAAAMEAAITEKTRALVPVHMFGRLVDTEAVLAVAAKHDLPVVEDASQAHAARRQGKHAGTFGAAGCFSFYPGKNLGAAGEAGVVITDDDALAERMRKFRNHGGTARYEHRVPGLNLRMTGFQGVVLGAKLPHLDDWTADRRAVAARFDAALAEIDGIEPPAPGPAEEQAQHLYVARTDRRDALREFLGERGLGSGIHYPSPVHRLEAYAHLGQGEGSCPVAEHAAERIVSLPIFPRMRDDEVDEVIAAIQEFFA